MGLIKGICGFGKADIVPYVHRMIAILFTVPIFIYLTFSFCEHNTSGFCL